MGAAAPVSARTTFIYKDARSASKHLVPDMSVLGFQVLCRSVCTEKPSWATLRALSSRRFRDRTLSAARY